MTQAIHYTFVHNMPGYLPEADPECYSTWEDAKSAAIDYLCREGDFYFDTGVEPGTTWADECSALAEELNLITEVRGIHPSTLGGRQEWSGQVGNVCYSITPDWHDHDDDDDDI